MSPMSLLPLMRHVCHVRALSVPPHPSPHLRSGFEAWELILMTALALWLLHRLAATWAAIAEDGGVLRLVFSALRSIPPVKVGR